jgi:hypothetical protein
MATPYSIGGFQTFLFTATPIFEIVGVAGMAPKIRELLFATGTQTTAQVATIGIGFPAVAGVTPTNVRGVIGDDLGAPVVGSLLRVVTDWGVPPTAPTGFFRRVSLGATASGGSARFYWPMGLRIPVGQTIVAWCITAATRGNFISFSVSLDA